MLNGWIEPDDHAGNDARGMTGESKHAVNEVGEGASWRVLRRHAR
jgi:hypothetical protein